jgi:phospholipid/cholesterol/gamma-HCH transport system substrate-binding protein
MRARHRLLPLLLCWGFLTGCGLQLQDVPMPKLVSGPTYRITAEFSDALNLPVDAPVKMDGATVGQVAAVEPGDYVALVTLAIAEDVELAGNSRAEIRLTSPMGTSFVQLLPGRKGEPLRDGDVISLRRTSEAPDISDLLNALSTVVTGGSFHDISTIIKQLNVALTGNTDSVQQLFRRLDRAVTRFNDELPTLDRLTASIEGRPLTDETEFVPPSLIVRESTAEVPE